MMLCPGTGIYPDAEGRLVVDDELGVRWQLCEDCGSWVRMHGGCALPHDYENDLCPTSGGDPSKNGYMSIWNGDRREYSYCSECWDWVPVVNDVVLPHDQQDKYARAW